jgi:mannose-6-phosphate isomerase-like protein (cupin superfamily)
MKRVVTGVDEQGRSKVVSVQEFDASAPHTLWTYDPKEIREVIAAIDPAICADWIGPEAPGGVIWRYTPMKPRSEAGSSHGKHPGIDENGFHTSRTIDFDIVATGELVLVLDTERVPLQTGDVVIQQATRHAWRNETDEPAVLVALLHRPAMD